jgi:hypothetical protein
VLALCSHAGLVRLGVVAVDGTKIAAAATHHATRVFTFMLSVGAYHISMPPLWLYPYTWSRSGRPRRVSRPCRRAEWGRAGLSPAPLASAQGRIGSSRARAVRGNLSAGALRWCGSDEACR